MHTPPPTIPLSSPPSAIRREAAVTCSRLLLSGGDVISRRGHAATVVSEVLDKLLIVGIADPGAQCGGGGADGADPTIRLAILASLDSRFDHFLAQAESIRSLFIALNDEVFEVERGEGGFDAQGARGRNSNYRPPHHTQPRVRHAVDAQDPHSAPHRTR
jgi:serine/threonine-protein kinase mTOR